MIPDKPREVGNEPLGRNREGKLSNSLKDWSKLEVFSKYDDSWVPVRKLKIVSPDVMTQSGGDMTESMTEICADVISLGPRVQGNPG